MTGVYLIPITENAVDNYNKTLVHADESLMKLIAETDSRVVQDLLERDVAANSQVSNLGLWSYINNKGNNNKSYWEQMKENDLVLFFDVQEKLSMVGRIYRKAEEEVSPSIAKQVFGQAEFDLFFSIKELVSFGKCHIKFSDVGSIAGYDFNFPRGNLRVKDWRVKDYDIVNRIYELILLETENEKPLGVVL